MVSGLSRLGAGGSHTQGQSSEESFRGQGVCRDGTLTAGDQGQRRVRTLPVGSVALAQSVQMGLNRVELQNLTDLADWQ